MKEIDFVERSKEKIIKVLKVDIKGEHVDATLITEQYGRRTWKPFKFSIDEWERVKERGYV